MSVVTMKQLLEAGVHFGHQTRRWNPKMKPFIFQERNGIYILDLQQTLKRIVTGYEFVRDTVRGGGKVMFVGTKKQANQAIKEEAGRCGMYYINQRWLGGLLTNFATLSKRIERLAELEAMEERGDTDAMNKKELKAYRTELNKLRKYLGGVRGMDALPDALVIIDLRKENIAFAEAKKLNIPVVALVDTNCDPTGVDYPIPGNDDAIRAVRLICKIMADAVDEGYKAATVTEEDFAQGQEGEAAAEARAPKAEEAPEAIDAQIDREGKQVFDQDKPADKAPAEKPAETKAPAEA